MTWEWKGLEAEPSPVRCPCVGYSRPWCSVQAHSCLFYILIAEILCECLIPAVSIQVCIERGEWRLLFTCKLIVQANMLVLMRLTREHDVVGTSLQLKQVRACVTPVATYTRQASTIKF